MTFGHNSSLEMLGKHLPLVVACFLSIRLSTCDEVGVDSVPTTVMTKSERASASNKRRV